MRLLDTLSLALLCSSSLVTAVTPPGFCPSVKKNLTVDYGFAKADGSILPQPDLGTQPTIWAKLPHHKHPIKKVILFMIDLDVPRNGTRVTLLHWFAYDVDPNTHPFTFPGTPTTSSTTPGKAPGAPYLRPNPPSGDVPHRYVFLLYKQPKDFKVPADFESVDPPVDTTARIGFNLTKFVDETELKRPVAANYIRVGPVNSTVPAGTMYPPIIVGTEDCHDERWWKKGW